MRNIKLTLAYDGSRYQGWQKQGNTDNTIQGKLETLLGRLLNEPIDLMGSGRTDAGVHAKAQVANFHTNSTMSLDDIQIGLCDYLPRDIAVIAIEEVPERFHSRLWAKQKTYCYHVWNSPISNVFERGYCFLIPEALDVEAMRAAAQYLIGEHDFKSFCANKRMKKSSIRTIYSISIETNGPEITFTYTGNGFLYNMVRILTGTLLEVGRGLLSPEDMSAIIESKNRMDAGPTAPAMGLFLEEVDYK